jgi:hypothetical protein
MIKNQLLIKNKNLISLGDTTDTVILSQHLIAELGKGI